MDILKKVFPISFNYASDVAQLIIGILIYVVASVVASVVLWLAGTLTLGLLGGLLSIVGWVVNVYVISGIVIQILVFLKVLN